MTWPASPPPPPPPPPPPRKPARRGGGLLVGAGWLLLVLAIVMLTQTNGSPLPAVLGAAGTLCVAIGAFMLSKGGPWAILLGFAATFACVAGLLLAANAREVAAQGRPVTCEVMAVRQESHTGLRDDDGQAETETIYVQTMKCPIGTYTLDRGRRPDPVGAKIEMVDVPGGQPRWAGVEGANLRVGVGATSVGVLVTLVLSLLGWRGSRRRAMAEQSRQQAAMRRFPPAPPPSSPYQHW
jgi:hypothetical protein